MYKHKGKTNETQIPAKTRRKTVFSCESNMPTVTSEAFKYYSNIVMALIHWILSKPNPE